MKHQIKKVCFAISFRVQCLLEYIYYNIQFAVKKVKYKKRYDKIQQFKDQYKGKRCFLIGTGPSLRDEDVLTLRGEYTFAVNSFAKAINKLQFNPTFYGFIDKECLRLYGDDIINNKESIIFYPRRTIFKEEGYEKLLKMENAYEFLMLDPGNWINFVKKVPWGFSGDASKQVYWGFTVVYSMLQIISYMGFDEIYLLGMDCSYLPGVSCYQDCRDSDKIQKGMADGNAVIGFIKSYEYAKRYAKKHNIRIYNATRGGKLEAFPRVDFDQIVKK